MTPHAEPVNSAAEFGAAIRARRKSLGLRLEDVALAAGTSVMFVSELERGKSNARLELSLRVARTVGLRITVSSGESA